VFAEVLLGHSEEIIASDFIFPDNFDIFIVEEPVLSVELKEIQYNRWAPLVGVVVSPIGDYSDFVPGEGCQEGLAGSLPTGFPGFHLCDKRHSDSGVGDVDMRLGG